MKYRRLGRTGLQVSVVGVGTWQFGGEWGKQFSQAEVDRILDRAGELGINLIDTAECYGDHLSERLIGQSLRGQRDRWIVATKFGHRFTGHLEREQIWTADGVRRQLEESLQALQVDTIDLYQFHSGTDADFDNDGIGDVADLDDDNDGIPDTLDPYPYSDVNDMVNLINQINDRLIAVENNVTDLQNNLSSRILLS